MKDDRELELVLNQALFIHIALADQGIPYVVPLCFGYRNRCIYLHGAPGGKKHQIMDRHNVVSFNCVADAAVVPGEHACSWTMNFRSVSGIGRARFITCPEEKHEALTCIMEHYGHVGEVHFPDIDRIEVICIHVDTMTGKQRL